MTALEQIFKNTKIKEQAESRFKMEILLDEDPCNPRDPNYQENLGNMVCFHGRYNLGDSHEFDSPQELNEFFEANEVIKLPLYLYDHSGITMSTQPFSCPWNSGQVGYIYMTKETLIKEYGEYNDETVKTALEYLKGEVKEYDLYIRNEVYGYKVYEVDENGDEVDEFDACWGFYGNEYCEESAKDSLKYARNNYIKEHTK